jgi:hypothetical protein
MAFLNSARTKALSLIKNDINEGKLGTDGTVWNISQTELIAGVSATELTITKSDLTNGFKVSYYLPEGIGNGNGFQEFGLISLDNTTYWTRNVFPQFDKTNDQVLYIDTYVEFDINEE